MLNNTYTNRFNKEGNNILTKEYIKDLKSRGNGDLSNLAHSQLKNVGNLVFILENLGNLTESFNAEWIVHLMYHSNENVRFWAVKNIGKIKTNKYLPQLYDIAVTDCSTIVQREAVSSIGRIRNIQSIPFLVSILENKDPKVVCQAIRALLVFKGTQIVDDSLRKLINHENEMIRTVIYKEYFAKLKTKKSVLHHTETYSFLKNVVVEADVRDVLKLVPDDSIHLTFTSPPYYNARDYAIYPSYEAYLNFLREVFEEVFRVTKEGRFLVVNTSPVIVPRISRAHSSKRYPIPFDLHYFLVQMGWEFVDDIVWKKPEYSVKNRVGGFQQHRKPLAYKPNSVTEYLMVYRKQTDKLLDWNMKQYSKDIVEDSKVADGFETTNVWEICPKSDKIHSAIFPVDLCKRVIEYYSFKGDLVFDPFGGSGTLGRTAKKLGRRFFLTEKEGRYIEYMKSFQVKKDYTDVEATRFLTLKQFKEIIL